MHDAELVHVVHDQHHRPEVICTDGRTHAASGALGGPSRWQARHGKAVRVTVAVHLQLFSQ